MIDRFTGKYDFLSNFFPCTIVVNGKQFKSYQACKTLNPVWDDMKVGIMYGLLCQKFTQHGELGRGLIATGNEILLEGNTWYDNFWGEDERTLGRGKNWLGILLMQRRTELQLAEK